jgi:ribosomal protein L29
MKGKLEELTLEELDKGYSETKVELRKEKFRSVTSKVDNPKKIKELKRHIARIETLKKEYSLKLRQPKGQI